MASQAMTSHWSLLCGNLAIARLSSSSRADAFGRAPPSPMVPVSRNCLTAADESSPEARSSSLLEVLPSSRV
ncbi:hypothetical protein [Actinomyces wuliandei]|uniref:hypothetical protein n=1 Tax=Actinomyces wuliandei TaxID=2057743 RepID=UPI001FAA810A|nr:hypothetical protein [Actinomyces wuliandei]